MWPKMDSIQYFAQSLGQNEELLQTKTLEKEGYGHSLVVSK